MTEREKERKRERVTEREKENEKERWRRAKRDSQVIIHIKHSLTSVKLKTILLRIHTF